MESSAVARVVKGGLWLYLSTIVNSIGGFLYWLVISGLAGSEIVGLTSATVGLATLIRSIISLGLRTGMQHFLGRCVGFRDKECFSNYFWTGMNLSISLYMITGSALILLGSLGYSFSSFTPEMLKLAGILVLLSVSIPIQAALLAMIRTDILSIAILSGNLLKFVIGIALVSAGWGFVGATIGFMAYFAGIAVLGGVYTVKHAGLKGVGKIRKEVLRELLKGSLVSWLPSIVIIAGQWVGVLAVFGYSGGVETGHYYIAYTIANIVLGVGIMMVNLLLPVLSGMREGKKAATRRVLRLSLVIVIPASVFIFAYSWVPLSLLGREYLDASSTLSVLILSSVPLTIYFAINSLIYSYRRYSDVLYLGLSQNVPRLVLYLAIVPWLKGLGAAISFTVGAYTGLVHATLLARKIGFRINWEEIAKSVAVPALLTAAAYLTKMPWSIAMAITATSYLLYGRVGILERNDVRDLAHAVLGKALTAKIYERTKWLIDSLFA